LAKAEGKVPSRQHSDYISPLPKFHPVPTKPVFEPQPVYPPLELLDPPGQPHLQLGPSLPASPG